MARTPQDSTDAEAEAFCRELNELGRKAADVPRSSAELTESGESELQGYMKLRAVRRARES